jgi:DNA-binding MurR/RpiR family transcriptional regulator
VAFFVSASSFQIQRLETDLLLDGHEVTLLTDLHDQSAQVNSLDRNSFVIFIKPEVPVTGNVRKLAQLAKARGARVLIISNSKSYVPNDYFDFVLSF